MKRSASPGGELRPRMISAPLHRRGCARAVRSTCLPPNAGRPLQVHRNDMGVFTRDTAPLRLCFAAQRKVSFLAMHPLVRSLHS